MANVKQELRTRLQKTLSDATAQPISQRRQTIRHGLSQIQRYCHSVEKTFIFCELEINCSEYDLGGHGGDIATLFRGPNEDASVAICITQKGSLLHRNDGPWQVYCNAGDIHPQSQGAQNFEDGGNPGRTATSQAATGQPVEGQTAEHQTTENSTTEANDLLAKTFLCAA